MKLIGKQIVKKPCNDCHQAMKAVDFFDPDSVDIDEVENAHKENKETE